MMKVVAVPPRLRFAVSILALCVPIAAIETIMVIRAPWWRLPLQTIEIWSLAVGLITVPLAMWMTYGKRWAFYLTAGFGLIWCLLSAWTAIRMKNPSLGFFTLSLVFYWIGVLLWLRFEMSRSFFDPQVSWYQGL